MPVTVYIPIRIRMSAKALEGCTCQMEEALSSAVSRALVKSRREVLAPRTGYAGIRMMAPGFQWCGDSVDLVAPARRRKVEEKVRASLAAEIQRVGLLRWGKASADADRPFSGRLREVFDGNRGSDTWGFYAVASYDKRGKRVAVPMKPKPSKPQEEIQTVDIWDPKPWDWYAKVSRQDFIRLFNETYVHWGWGGGTAPFLGIIWRASGGSHPLQIYVGNHSTGEAMVFNIGEFTKYAWVPKANSTTGEHELKYTRYLPDPGVSSIDWRTAEEIRGEIRASAEKNVKALPKPPYFTEKEWHQKIPQVIETEVATRTKFIGSETHFLAVTIGNITNFSIQSTAKQFPGKAPLMPMTAAQVVEISEGEAAGAGAAGAGAGEGAGQGAGAGTAAGQIQPHWGSSGALHYPGIYDPNGRSPERCKDGYRGEPSLDKLPAATANKLRGLINEIAYLLEMEPCEYAASFCLAAATEVGIKALTVSKYSVLEGNSRMVELAPRKDLAPNVVDFLPSVSPGILFLRVLASAVPRISHLADEIGLAYRAPGGAELLEGYGRRGLIDWLLPFGGAVYDRLRMSVVRHFVATTQVLFMQMLASSLENIKDRLSEENFNGYAAFFEVAVHSLLIPRQELEDLRTQLKNASKNFVEQLTDWRPAVSVLMDDVLGRKPATGIITMAPNGDRAVRDKRGRVWTKDSLDRAVALTGDISTMIDPLMNQLLADEDVRLRFTRNQADIPGELKKLLQEMVGKNAEFTYKIRNDAGFAFQMAALAKVDKEHPANVPGLDWSLSGIHAMAAEAVGEFFERNRYYVIGLNAALSTIQFGRDMMAIAEFGTVAVCAIFCPALVALVVQTGWSLYHEVELREKKRLYGALMDPEAILNYAQLEAELFANHVGIVLNFIPADRILMKGLGIDKGLAKLAATKAGQWVAKRITREMIEELEKVTIFAFAKFMATGEVMGAIMQRMLKPFIDEIQQKHMTLAQVEAAAAEVFQ